MRLADRRVQTTYPVRLTCQVIGKPIPNVIWFKNDKEILQDGKHVVFIKVIEYILHYSIHCKKCCTVTKYIIHLTQVYFYLNQVNFT